jgi:3-dehydro-4-phosphotetronate decarboxylase
MVPLRRHSSPGYGGLSVTACAGADHRIALVPRSGNFRQLTFFLDVMALSMLPDADEESVLPPLTPDAIINLGKVTRNPSSHKRPEDRKGGGWPCRQRRCGDAGKPSSGRGRQGRRSSSDSVEKMEDAVRRALLTRGPESRMLTAGQIAGIVVEFDVEWDD